MADLARTGVVKRKNYRTGGNNGSRFTAYECTVTLAAMGTAANKVLASAFGLDTITHVTPFVKTDDTLVIAAGPSNDGTHILLKAAGTNAPADYTGEFKCVVWGNA
jgi:hypothetical protein